MLKKFWKQLKKDVKSFWNKLKEGIKHSWTMRAALGLTAVQVFDAVWPVFPEAYKVSHWGVALTVLFAILRMRTL